jgi:hypothetical protein
MPAKPFLDYTVYIIVKIKIFLIKNKFLGCEYI